MQGAVGRWDFYNFHLTTNLPENLPLIFYRLRFDSIMVIRLCPHFWPTLYMYTGGSVTTTTLLWLRP